MVSQAFGIGAGNKSVGIPEVFPKQAAASIRISISIYGTLPTW